MACNHDVDGQLEDQIWQLLLTLKRHCAGGRRIERPKAWRLDERGEWTECSVDAARVALDPAQPTGFRLLQPLGPAAQQLLDLHVGWFVGPAAGLPIAHLGQSLDGRIATVTGRSQFITAEDNLTHMHRLRALSDAVIVGCHTVQFDDPRLTTRKVAGAHPTRVVIDPQGRLAGHEQVFQDSAAPTLLLTTDRPGLPDRIGRAEVVRLAANEGRFAVALLLDVLRERGLHRLFIEGGGVTVSRFLQAGALGRLQITVAPVLLGSGRPGVSLPTIDHLGDALRLPGLRRFEMGPDLLFDCPFSKNA